MDTLLIVLIVVAIIATIIIFLHLQNNLIDITSYSINNNMVSNDVKIVHLSDLHSKPFKKVLTKTKQLTPDIICITGDYINDHCKNKNKMLEFGQQLVKIAPVFYITGNHERRLDNFETLMKELSSIGFTVLLNQKANLQIRGINISILGLDENQASFEDYKARRNGTFVYKDMSSYFKLLDDNSNFKIVLSHFPENFRGVAEMNYEQYNFDIQLSGHAHGGQFCLPFIGPVLSPGQGLFPKYAKGSFGKKPKLIISRGLGNAEFPFRLFNHPEINVINIKNN